MGTTAHLQTVRATTGVRHRVSSRVAAPLGGVESIGLQLTNSLLALHRGEGIPVAFGGVFSGDAVRLTALKGTTTDALRGLSIRLGHGLGGKAGLTRQPQWVSDYRAATTISHDYDTPVQMEGLRTVVAVPVVVRRDLRAILYGALRQPIALGDRLIMAITATARDLEQELAVAQDARHRLMELELALAAARSPTRPDWEEIRHLHAELRVLSQQVPDAQLRESFLRLSERLAATAAGTTPRPGQRRLLSGRELDVLGCVAVGQTNADIARQLGILPETVKSYLRSAMRKLNSHTRLEAVSAARRAHLLP